MFKSPYNTSSLKDYDLTKIVSEIQRSLITQSGNNEVRQMSDLDVKKVLPVYELLPQAEHVGAFTQPIIVQHKDENIVVVDVRPIVRENRIGEITISSTSDYKLLSYYGVMCSSWLNGGQSILQRNSAFAGRVFVTWVSGLVTRALNLDMLNQVTLKVITGMYFECLFNDDEKEELTDREKQQYAIAAGKYSYANTQTATDILKDVPLMSNLDDFIKVLHTVSPRFEALTKVNLFAMVGRSWFGANAPTLCAVSLEYPPAFYTMSYFALNYRGYNKTGIGNIVYASRTTAEAKQFKTGIERLFDEAMY